MRACAANSCRNRRADERTDGLCFYSPVVQTRVCVSSVRISCGAVCWDHLAVKIRSPEKRQPSRWKIDENLKWWKNYRSLTFSRFLWLFLVSHLPATRPAIVASSAKTSLSFASVYVAPCCSAPQSSQILHSKSECVSCFRYRLVGS